MSLDIQNNFLYFEQCLCSICIFYPFSCFISCFIYDGSGWCFLCPSNQVFPEISFFNIGGSIFINVCSLQEPYSCYPNPTICRQLDSFHCFVFNNWRLNWFSLRFYIQADPSSYSIGKTWILLRDLVLFGSFSDRQCTSFYRCHRFLGCSVGYCMVFPLVVCM